MTVRLPLRISTTCDAVFLSLALAPETKKPQNPAAMDGRSSTANPNQRDMIPLFRYGYVDRKPYDLSHGGQSFCNGVRCSPNVSCKSLAYRLCGGLPRTPSRYEYCHRSRGDDPRR